MLAAEREIKIVQAFFPEQPEIKCDVWNLGKIIKMQTAIDQDYLIEAQKTRGETFRKRQLAFWVELGELVNEWKELFKFWSNKKMNREKALEEYADGLHFIISLGCDLNMQKYHIEVIKYDDPIDQIFILSGLIPNIRGVKSFSDVLAVYRGLGEHFGFSKEEIENAYYKKHEENKVREDHLISG
jgi:dimeric dUTPase (all-alpha-NTP-PPase superfamily)